MGGGFGSTQSSGHYLDPARWVGRTLTDVYPATYYSWRRKLQEQGEEGFRQGVTAKQLKELRHLEKENRQLKELVAEKELFIRALKEARLKKG